MKNFVFCLFLFSIAARSPTAQSNWSPEQCLKLKNIAGTVVSPDGTKLLYAEREALMTDDRSEYINQIWLVDLKAINKPVQLTRGDKNNSQPAWSPDGQWISFVSNRDGKNNLYLLPVAGGEAEKVTDVKSGVGLYKWSRDGQAIATLIADPTEDDDEKNTISEWASIPLPKTKVIKWKSTDGQEIQGLLTYNYVAGTNVPFLLNSKLKGYS